MLVIYHADCFDGIVAAWIARSKYGNDAEYIAAAYGDNPPDVTDRTVIILDFSYPPNILAEMCDKAKLVTVLDHHETAIERIDEYFERVGYPDNLDLRLDMTRSGAGLAWDIIFPNKQRPAVVNYVEDHDLWKFELPNTRAFIAGFATMPIEIDSVTYAEAYSDHLIDVGEPLVAQEDQQINRHLDESFLVSFGGYDNIPMSNVPRYNGSRVGEELIKKYNSPFSITWYEDAKYRYYRLRSLKSSDVNVATIAEQHGGGGHTNAASFKRDRIDHLNVVALV